MTEDIVEKFKIKCQPIKDFTQVWNSQDTQSQSQVSLWYPSLSVSMMSTNKVKNNEVCFLFSFPLSALCLCIYCVLLFMNERCRSRSLASVLP